MTFRVTVVSILAAATNLTALLADSNPAPPGVGPSEVLFGHGVAAGRAGEIVPYLDFAPQGKFFATADYRFVPGQEDKYTGDSFGLKGNGALCVRGQDVVSSSMFFSYDWSRPGWLSDGGDCVFGVSFDQPFKSLWANRPYLGDQFADFKGSPPLFDQAVIYWGELVPQKGTWGACLVDAEGNMKKIEVDRQRPIYPLDMTTLNFQPTTVKELFFGLKGGKDNLVQVRRIALNLHNPQLVDNRLAVFQMDAYTAAYSKDVPGMVAALQVCNLALSANPSDPLGDGAMLNSLTPFVELDGKRHYAAKGEYPVQVESDGRVRTLRYPLSFVLPDGGKVALKVVATYGVGLKDTIKYAFVAETLPKGARLGFEMSGSAELFGNYIDQAAPSLLSPQVFTTPAGPLGVAAEGADNLVSTLLDKTVRFDLFAEGDELEVSLSLPIGPEAGVQPGMLDYNWYPSLAGQGDEGVAPFKMADLELLDSVDFSAPNGRPVYDISNDPLILNWRKSGEKRLPSGFGSLKLMAQPERGKVPLATALGQKCRAINNLDSCYFRVDLNCKFEPRVPYLFVVEHAFDQERRGEFHIMAAKPDGAGVYPTFTRSAPFGCFDTGKGPYERRFKKESVFSFQPYDAGGGYSQSVQSLCFTNSFAWNHRLKALPEGLAIKSVSVYRVKHMPELPDMRGLLPEGPRRHVTISTENTSPWSLSQLPKLAGYNTVWNHTKPTAFFLHGKAVSKYLPGGGASDWHAGTLESQRWLLEKAESLGMYVNVSSSSLVELGFEGTGYRSFKGDGNLTSGVGRTSFPLCPTEGELERYATALDRSLAVLAPYKSLRDVCVSTSALSFFTKRNLDDFSRETGVAFVSGPAPIQNFKALLDSDRKTVDSWISWSCRKRFEHLDWLLKLLCGHRSDLHLTLNLCAHKNAYQWAYFGSDGETGPLGRLCAGSLEFKAKGINNYLDFLKLVCHDPALYAGKDGFGFAIEGERTFTWNNMTHWPSFYHEKWFATLRDSFASGLSVAASDFEEGPKPLASWICHYVKDRRSFRRNLVEALLYANAREFNTQTYGVDPYRGRLDDMRQLSVPFQLLPFAKPEPFAGKISDSAKQAVIKKYGDRHALFNPGDQPTDVTLTLPDGAERLFDLSNGVRQGLVVGAPIHLEPWSLRTLEIK